MKTGIPGLACFCSTSPLRVSTLPLSTVRLSVFVVYFSSPFTRFVRALAEVEGKQDHGVFISPLWKPHSTRGCHPVGLYIHLPPRLLTASSFMNNSAIIEEGNHEALIMKGGEYAKLWMMQARAFL
jgi:hypothetical protein